MKTLILLSFVFTFATCNISRDLYDEIKKEASFEMLEYEEMQDIFKDTTFKLKEESNFHPVISDNAKQQLENQQNSFLSDLEQYNKLPLEFDWRKQMPDCITPVKDQALCGSCYAFSATTALETRICIKSHGRLKVNLSAQDVVSCDKNNHKCHGDSLDNTWGYLENVGTCDTLCKPYASQEGQVPRCFNTCTNPKFPGLSYAKWRAYPNTWKIMNNSEVIKQEIYANGPVSAGIQTFQDFSTYRRGIYIHSRGKETDHHAVVIFGWGYDPNYRSQYWILRNSWGPRWGDSGYFKILFGMYEVDAFANASLPLI